RRCRCAWGARWRLSYRWSVIRSMRRLIRPRMLWIRCHFDSCPGEHGETGTRHSVPGAPGKKQGVAYHRNPLFFPAGPTRLELATSGVTGRLEIVTCCSLFFVCNTLACRTSSLVSPVSTLCSCVSVTNLSPQTFVCPV